MSKKDIAMTSVFPDRLKILIALFYPISSLCNTQIDTSQLVWTANQLIGFDISVILA